MTVEHAGELFRFEKSTDLDRFFWGKSLEDVREMVIKDAGSILRASNGIVEALSDWDYYEDLLKENKSDAEIARLWVEESGKSIQEWEQYYWGVYDSYDDFVEEFSNENIFYDVPQGYRKYIDYYFLGSDLGEETITIDLPNGTVAIFHY